MTSNEAPEQIELEDVTIQTLPDWVAQELAKANPSKEQ